MLVALCQAPRQDQVNEGEYLAEPGMALVAQESLVEVPAVDPAVPAAAKVSTFIC